MTEADRAKVKRLMKRCQIGVGGRNAVDNAHYIMAECYGTLGKLMAEVERLQGVLDSRPAINAGLEEAYTNWSRLVYSADMAQAVSAAPKVKN